MNEREFEGRIAAWYADELSSATVETQSLYERVAVIPDTVPVPFWSLSGRVGSRRSLWLLAAAVLLALALTAVAVGSGLIRLPWLPKDGVPLIGAGCQLHGELPPGQVLVVRLDDVPRVAEEAPPDEFSPPDQLFIRVLADGLVLNQRWHTEAQIAAVDPAITMRRLTPRGVELVLAQVEAVAESDGCLGRFTDRPLRGVDWLRADGAHASRFWGRGYANELFRIMTRDEEAVVDDFEWRISNLTAWLPADAWADATERPYDPEQWLFRLENVRADQAATFGRPLDGSDAPPFDGITLANGTPIGELGSPWREPDSTYRDSDGDHVERGRVGRCAALSTATAREIAGVLNGALSPVFNGGWWLFDPPDQVTISIRPLLPLDEACSDRVLNIQSTPAAVRTPAPPTIGGLGPIDPCAMLDPATLELVMPVEQFRRVDSDLTSEDGGPLGPDFRECSYVGGNYTNNVDVAIHIEPVASADARAHVEALLGADAVEVSADGRPVWRNACNGWCRPALVISVEPYLVLVSYTMNDGGVDAGSGLNLSRAIIRALEGT